MVLPVLGAHARYGHSGEHRDAGELERTSCTFSNALLCFRTRRAFRRTPAAPFRRILATGPLSPAVTTVAPNSACCNIAQHAGCQSADSTRAWARCCGKLGSYHDISRNAGPPCVGRANSRAIASPYSLPFYRRSARARTAGMGTAPPVSGAYHTSKPALPLKRDVATTRKIRG